MRASSHHGIQYEHIQGNRELRRQIAKQAFNWGGKFSEEEVVVRAGWMEALGMCRKAVTQPGDAVAIENPTYFGIFQVIELLGLKVLEIPADPLTGVDPGHLETLIDQFPVKACVFVPNFSNPLGSCMPEEKKQALVELATRRRIPLIEDDIYGELYFARHLPTTGKPSDKERWVLQYATLSKSLV